MKGNKQTNKQTRLQNATKPVESIRPLPVPSAPPLAKVSYLKKTVSQKPSRREESYCGNTDAFAVLCFMYYARSPDAVDVFWRGEKCSIKNKSIEQGLNLSRS
jgi:hypothetical protein